MRIKLFENFHKSPMLLDSFQEAEAKLSDKEGIVMLGVTGDMTHIEDAIKGLEYDEAYVLITDQSSHVASSWKSDVFLVGAVPDKSPADETTFADYFKKNESEVSEATEMGTKYKLKKDMPNVKAGSIYKKVGIAPGKNAYVVESKDDWVPSAITYPALPITIVEKNPEWFEKI